MEIIQQLLVVVVLWTNDGSFNSTATPVNECPDIAVFSASLEARRHAKEFKSWVAYCTPAEFGVASTGPKVDI